MTDDTTHSSNPAYLLKEGMTIKDKWEIQQFIAKGGKGEVYLARQRNLDRQVALKIMSQEFIKSLEGDEEEINSEIKRFHREVQIMARMQHPNILQVYDFDRLKIHGAEMDYIVMEYVPGQTLRQKMPEQGFGYDEHKVKNWLKKFFFPILDGMKVVHAKDVIHRDLKPENVLIDNDLPKIMDFGIAGGYHLDNVTQTHHMLGTITYMPQEQFIDLGLTDERVDIYALGKIMYEVVEGKMRKGRDKPFNSVSLDAPPSDFFKTLDRIIQQATAKNRSQRTSSVKELHDSLEELLTDYEKHKNSRIGAGPEYWKYWFFTSAAIFVILTVTIVIHNNSVKLTTGLNEVHIRNQPKVINPATASLILPEFKYKAPRLTLLPPMNQLKKLPARILASDNMSMILLPGANISVSIDQPMALERKQTSKKIYVNAFYMDKTKITNHLYVQFLNEIDGIEIKKQSVLRHGQLLLLLGEVREGYEPITFKDGKFRVKSDDIAKPVVRVTPTGAMAYASFYGKSLPSMAQWQLAVQTGHDPVPPKNTATSPPPTERWDKTEMMHAQSAESAPLSTPQASGILPVTQTTANRTGIQGLEQNVNEWAMMRSSGGTPEFHIHGGVGELDHRDSYLERQPWEAFARVGFRTVLNLGGEK